MEYEKITLNTILLQNVTRKLLKGLGSNKIVPYTNYITIKLKDKQLTFYTSDGNNTYLISLNVDCEQEDTYSIMGEQFIKLVQKITTETITLKHNNTLLEIIGNGVYKMDILTDIVPEPALLDVTSEEVVSGKLNIKDLLLFDTASAALGKLIVNPMLMGYYLNDKDIVTTDGIKLSIATGLANSFTTPFYLTQRMVELLLTIDGTVDINLYQQDGVVMIVSDNYTIYGGEQPGKGDYPNYLNFKEFELTQTLLLTDTLSNIQNIIDRVKILSNNTIYLKTVDDKLCLQDTKGTQEVLTTDVAEIPISLNVLLDVQALSDLINKQKTNITIGYCEGYSPIFIKTPNLVQILAPLTEGNTNE